MESLPPEMFESIFGNVTELADLLNLRGVNKFFYSIFTARAFGRMYFKNTHVSTSRLMNVASSRLAEWVLELHFDIARYPETRASTNELPTTTQPGPLKVSISTFTHIQSIAFIFPKRCYSEAYPLTLQATMFGAFMYSPLAPSLTSLTVTNFTWWDSGLEFTKRPEFARFLGGLEHLSLQAQTELAWTDRVYMPLGFPGDWLIHMQRNLRSLVLKQPLSIVHFPPGLNFCKLEKLELHNMLFSQLELTGIETFIVSEPVASTLKELYLSSCAICYEDWAKNKNRTWADTLSVFQKSLKNLSRFEIISPLTYVAVVMDGGFHRLILPEKDVSAYSSADNNALDSLWRSIGQEQRVKSGAQRFVFPTVRGDIDGLDLFLVEFDFDAFLNSDDDPQSAFEEALGHIAAGSVVGQ